MLFHDLISQPHRAYRVEQRHFNLHRMAMAVHPNHLAPHFLQRWLDAGKELIFASDCHDRRFLLHGFEAMKDIPHRERLC